MKSYLVAVNQQGGKTEAEAALIGHFIVMTSKCDWLGNVQSGVNAVLSNNW